MVLEKAKQQKVNRTPKLLVIQPTMSCCMMGKKQGILKTVLSNS